MRSRAGLEGTSPYGHRRRRLGAASALAMLVAVGVLLGVPSAVAGPTQTVELFILSDAVRVPQYQAYAAAHPNVKLNIQTIAGPDILTKIQLAITSGAPVPDVAFPGSNPAAATMKRVYAADLSKAVPKAVQDGFAAGSLAPCRQGARLLCLRNDLAQVMLWFDVTLFNRYGYKVPTTWQQYTALAVRVAREHPGTIVGSFGTSITAPVWFSTFECPTNQLINPTTVLINMAAPGCKRMVSVVDPLLRNGALSKVGEFDPAFARIVSSGNLLMMIGPSWAGDFLFKGTWRLPNGRIVANQPLAWGKEPIVTGFLGGGNFMAYKGSQNLARAIHMVRWLTTNAASQASSPTYPAYVPAARAWSARRAGDPFYVRNPAPALARAATAMSEKYDWVTYNVATAYDRTIGPAVQGGRTLASAMAAYQADLTSLARQENYKIVRVEPRKKN